jgi:hypothetical protein
MAARARSRVYDDSTAKPKPRSDVYTGLLVLSLLAQIAGCVFLYLDYSEYKTDKPPTVASIQAPAPPPVAPAPAPPVAPPK